MMIVADQAPTNGGHAIVPSLEQRGHTFLQLPIATFPVLFPQLMMWGWGGQRRLSSFLNVWRRLNEPP